MSDITENEFWDVLSGNKSGFDVHRDRISVKISEFFHNKHILQAQYRAITEILKESLTCEKYPIVRVNLYVNICHKTFNCVYRTVITWHINDTDVTYKFDVNVPEDYKL